MASAIQPPSASIQQWAYAIKACTTKVLQVALAAFAALTNDMSTLASMIGKVDRHIVPLLADRKVVSSSFAALFTGTFGVAAGGVMSFFGILQDLNFFAEDKTPGKEPSKVATAANAAALAVDAGYGFLWLGEVGFIDTGKIAASIGQFRLFGCIPRLTACIPGIKNSAAIRQAAEKIGGVRLFSAMTKLPLGTMLGGVLACMHALFALEAWQQRRGANDGDRAICSLKVAESIVNCTLQVLTMLMVGNMAVLAALALHSIVLTISRFAIKALEENKRTVSA